MATWGDVYLAVSRILLEDGQFRLGLITDAQFYGICGEVWVEFLSYTGIAKKSVCLPLLFGIGQYSIPDSITEVDSVTADERYLYQTSDFFLSNTDPSWHEEMGQPENFIQDVVAPLNIRIEPKPNFSGNQVGVAQGQGGYGVIGAVSNPLDFTLQPQQGQGAFGTPGAQIGQLYGETLTPGFGVVGQMCCSRSNIEVFGTCIPYNIGPIVSTTPIFLVPDSLVPYLKYGVLARIFSSDSELKSEAKAKYADTRYREGVSFLVALMGGEEE